MLGTFVRSKDIAKQLNRKCRRVRTDVELPLYSAAEWEVHTLTRGLVPVDANTVGHTDGFPLFVEVVGNHRLDHQHIDVRGLRFASHGPQLQGDDRDEELVIAVFIIDSWSQGVLATAQRIPRARRQLRRKAESPVVRAVVAFLREKERGQQVVDAGVGNGGRFRIARWQSGHAPRIVRQFYVGDTGDVKVAHAPAGNELKTERVSIVLLIREEAAK